MYHIFYTYKGKGNKDQKRFEVSFCSLYKSNGFPVRVVVDCFIGKRAKQARPYKV